MELQDAHVYLSEVLSEIATQLHKLPGSAILVRYIKSSYQNDPIRSAVELFLFLFAVRYLLAPKYSPQRPNYVQLTEDVCRPLKDGGGEGAESCVTRRSMIWSRTGRRNLSLAHRRLSRKRRATRNRW